MNAKQTNEDKIYVYSSFKQFCWPVLVFLVLLLCTALNQDYSFLYKFTVIVYYRNCSDPEMLGVGN